VKKDPETGESLRDEDGKVIWESKYDGDNFPINFYFQCLHYLAVTGWKRWYLAALVDGTMHYRIIERDDPQVKEFTAELIERERIFWNEIVLKRNEEELESWM
jgi:predicted phage-related endonuclease